MKNLHSNPWKNNKDTLSKSNKSSILKKIEQRKQINLNAWKWLELELNIRFHYNNDSEESLKSKKITSKRLWEFWVFDL